MMITALCVYLAIALFIAASTFIEGEEKQIPWSFARIAGLLLSLVWPVLILIFRMHVLLERAKLVENEPKIDTRKLRKTP